MIAAVRKELEERFQDGDFGKHAYLQSAYTKDEEAALKWKEELMAEFGNGIPARSVIFKCCMSYWCRCIGGCLDT